MGGMIVSERTRAFFRALQLVIFCISFALLEYVFACSIPNCIMQVLMFFPPTDTDVVGDRITSDLSRLPTLSRR